MNEIKRAKPDHPIDELFITRFSPYVFDERLVPMDDLNAIFEAARWAPSSQRTTVALHSRH